MSVAFASIRPREKGEVTQQTIQKMLDENHHLIQCIVDYQSKGKAPECTQYQQVLHRNLVYLATIANSNQNMQSLLPAPPTQNMNIGAGGVVQTGNSQALHSQSNLNNGMATGAPPTPIIQGQMRNEYVLSGPCHTSMQPSGQTSVAPTSVSTAGSSGGHSHTVTSLQGAQTQNQGPSVASYPSHSNLNMQSNQVTMMHQQAAVSHYPSAQTGSQRYQGMLGQGNQGNNIMAQRSIGSYRPSQQGAAARYMGQDEFYGEQYSHGQSAAKPINQQYYTDGHGDYLYQQSSYSEQGYERSFEESSQHYYEGGNSQYNQQQSSYQQGGNQAAFNLQQYPSQQGYSGQQQAYGSSQGASSQYPGYQQGQQYSSYRSSQGAPTAQAQRPYGYEQGQYGDYQQ